VPGFRSRDRFPYQLSAGKIAGVQGRKIGNHYLKWAFIQAVIIGKRSGPFKKYADHLMSKHGKRRANTILAHRLAIAIYFMLRNHGVFDMELYLKGKVKVA